MISGTGSQLMRAILCEPVEDTPRLAYADWLEENAGTMPCAKCKGTGRNHNPDYDESQPCGSCYASGTVLNGNAERAEFVRVQIALSRLPPKPVVLGTGIAGAACLTSAGPDYWTFSEGENPRVKVGDRVDVVCHPVMLKGRDPKPKTLHGLVVTRITDRGSDGIQYVVKRDDDSKPWAGGELRVRERNLWERYAEQWFEINWGGRGILHGCRLTQGELDECSLPVKGLVSRGFISAVTLTTAAFLGGECSCVMGTEQLDGSIRREPLPYSPKCRHCHGTGRTPGIARELFERNPIERVTLSDRDPEVMLLHNLWRWAADAMPLELWLKLPATMYHTRDAAIAALSTACVNLGRELAGLPPLPKEPKG